MVEPLFDKGQEKDQFSMTIGGKTYTDRKEAGTALIAACAGLKTAGVDGQVGEFCGFGLYAGFDSFSFLFQLKIKGKCSYQIEMGNDPLGNLQRINNALLGIGGKLAEAELQLKTVQQQLATAKEEVGKPFAKEAELSEKMGRLSELNALLNMDEKDPSEALSMDDNGMPEELDVDGGGGDKEMADCPRRAEPFAGRVRMGTKPEEIKNAEVIKDRKAEEKGKKPSVLNKLKDTKERIAENQRNKQRTGKKKGQEL